VACSINGIFIKIKIFFIKLISPTIKPSNNSGWKLSLLISRFNWNLRWSLKKSCYNWPTLLNFSTNACFIFLKNTFLFIKYWGFKGLIYGKIAFSSESRCHYVFTLLKRFNVYFLV
jgi:hypothetical protein